MIEFIKSPEGITTIIACYYGLMKIARAIVRLTPTKKDDHYVDVVDKFMDMIIPNKKKE